MEENKIAELFYTFLEEEKGFPRTSLLKQAPTYYVGGSRAHIDLLLLDVRIGNYIGLVEFKSQINPQIKNNLKAQTEIYAKAIKSEGIPTYLVYPIYEEDFQILVYGEEDWVSISKSEFPEFETLSAKKKIEERIDEKELEELNIENIKHKQDYKKRTSLWALTSLILGMLTAIITFYVSINEKNKKPDYILDLTKKVSLLEFEILNLETNLNKVSVLDTLFVIDSTKTFVGINKRLENIENGIMNNSEKTLALKNTNQQIELLRQEIQSQEKLIELRIENIINRIEWLNAIVIGMVVALFSSAIGFVISNYYDKKNTRVNNGYK